MTKNTESNCRAWSEQVSIPTYAIGEPNRNPMFLEKRVYQGSSGAVYPHPVIDEISSEKVDREWTAVFLENEFIKLMILPELGGRLQMAQDKTNGYHFIYHNQVIKPALVGLTGPWISGGMEFNWPQHHRPSTYEPVNWSIEEHEDGSRTVWCAETERMFRTRGRHGFRLYPDRTGFDVVVRLSNRSDEPQTFLWWANPAVHVNDDYQSVFPPDVHAVMDHGKRDVSDFPIATGVYYKQDYAPGTDISRYKNIPVPTSYMAYHSDYNFVGCYDHGPRAGMLHVANHHVVPGKKQWTWGNSDFGLAWDRQLTDEDGPYIELMCGAYTDNQPDFTWIMPGEEKSFTQTFLPYKEIGPASNASRDVVVRMTVEEARAEIGLYAAAPFDGVVELWRNPAASSPFHNHKNMHLISRHRPLDPNAVNLYEKPVALGASEVWREAVQLDADFQGSELTLRLVSKDRETVLLEYTPPSGETPEIPSPATPAKAPADISSNEELFLNGLHLEQYRHATYAPEPYYEEALRRDPGDSRCHIAMGRLLLHRGAFAESETHLRSAIDRLTLRNPNPTDGEAYYHLGRCLRFQNRGEEAFDVYYKAAWSEAWKSPACFELARLAATEGRLDEALHLVDESLVRNTRHQKANHLRISLLRRLGRHDKAADAARTVLRRDPLEPGARYEAQALGLDNVPTAQTPLQAYEDLELGLDYLWAGDYAMADGLFERAANREFLALYFAAWSAHLQGQADDAHELFLKASRQALDYAFPNLLECMPALQAALEVNPEDALAAYAIGNFFYAHRRYEPAIACWEQCVGARPDFPTAWRNIGLACMNKRQDPKRAGEALRKAFEADPTDARVLYELDQLAKETACPVAERLERMEAYQELVLERDDLCVEYLRLLNLSGRAEETLQIMLSRNFQPWEGGEGKAAAQYLRCRILLAMQAAEEDRLEDARKHLEAAGTYPDNLNESPLGAATDNERWLHLGRVLERLEQTEDAKVCFHRATLGESEPAGAMYYNDQPPENIFFQGLAWRALGDEGKATEIFSSLLEYAQTHRDEEVQMDYFAVSLPDFLVFEVDLAKRNRQHCRYMEALGELGLGHEEASCAATSDLLGEVPDHQVVWNPQPKYTGGS